MVVVNMNVMEILDRLDEYLSECSRVPLVGKLMVDEDEVFNLIDDLRAALPKELEEARWVLKQREDILQDAQKQREDMLGDAQGQIAVLASETVIAKEARSQADDLMAQAKEVALEINRGARQYAFGVLEQVEKTLQSLLEATRLDKEQLLPEAVEQEAVQEHHDEAQPAPVEDPFELEEDQTPSYKRRRRDRVR